MIHKQNKEPIFYLALFTLFLVTWIMNWGYSLIQKDYISVVTEGFELCPSDRSHGGDLGLPQTSHTVNLPINTTYTCQNFCGPPARCSKTGQQCTSDIDCLGCRPVIMAPNVNPGNIKGFNHAGKLLSIMPDYSQLTTDMTRETYIYKDKKTAPPPSYFQGINTWKKPFTIGAQMYDQRYAPSIDDPSLAVNYPQRYTLSGEFMDDGPLAANAFLHE